MVYLKENYKKILPYAGIFFVLFIGSGLVRIPVGSVWFYVIKFGIIAAVLGIGVSAWWKAKKNNLPPTDYLKLALFVPFTIDFHLHYAFIFLTIILFNKKLLLPWNSPLKPIYLLFIWGCISYVINQFVEFNPLSFPFFIVTFFLPWIFFGLVALVKIEFVLDKLLDFYINLILILMLVLACQTIVLWELNPDFRTGGTVNSHTAGSLLSIAFIFSFYQILNRRGINGEQLCKTIIVLIFTLPFLYLIDAKYILVWLFVSTFSVTILFKVKSFKFKIGIVIFIIMMFMIWYQYTDRNLLLSQNAARSNSFYLDNIIENFAETPKAKLLNDGLHNFKNEPLVFFIGAGPGTFFSRAANSRSSNRLIGIVTYGANYFEKSTKLPDIVKPFDSWVRKKYGDFSITKHGTFSSIFDSRSSLINIHFEFGVFGLIIFLTIIFKFAGIGSYNIKNAALYGLELLSLTLFFILMGFFELWYEQPQFLIVVVMFFAIYNYKGAIINEK